MICNANLNRDRMVCLYVHLSIPLPDWLTVLSSTWRAASPWFVWLVGLSTQSVDRNNTRWFETEWNPHIQFIDKNRIPISSGASEWASKQMNKRSGTREQSEQWGVGSASYFMAILPIMQQRDVFRSSSKNSFSFVANCVHATLYSATSICWTVSWMVGQLGGW